jgi:hypothetical protein
MSLHIRAASQKPKACSIFEQLEQARGQATAFPLYLQYTSPPKSLGNNAIVDSVTGFM